MSRYYFLGAALESLQLEGDSPEEGFHHFWELCRSQLSAPDWETFRRGFIFQDLTNLRRFKKADDPFLTPSYYTREEFLDNLSSPGEFFPFMEEYLRCEASGHPSFPELEETEQAAALFYQSLDQFCTGFLRDYFLFELDLRNIFHYLARKSRRQETQGALLPFGEAWELLESKGVGALEGDWPRVGLLQKLVEGGQYAQAERLCEDIRWEWLVQNTQGDDFSFSRILGYGLMFQTHNRWRRMTLEEGEGRWQSLLERVRRSARFAIQFNRKDKV